MAWLSHNSIQSEGSIHATCNNLVCCKTGLNVTWVVQRTTYILNSFCSNVAKQVLPNTPVSLSRFFLAKNYPVYPQGSQCKNFECNYWLTDYPPSLLLAHATFPFLFLRIKVWFSSLSHATTSLLALSSQMAAHFARYSKFQQDIYPQKQLFNWSGSDLIK